MNSSSPETDFSTLFSRLLATLGMHKKLSPDESDRADTLSGKFLRISKYVSEIIEKFQPEIFPRVAPFLVYMAGLALSNLLDLIGDHRWDLRWLYALRVALVALVLFVHRRKYQELKFNQSSHINDWLLALVSGCFVFVAWVNLDVPWLAIQHDSGFNPIDNGAVNLPLVMARLIGATLIVPVMEELFWRSFLLRWLESEEFTDFDPARITLRSFAIVTVLFGFEHNLWFAGMIAAIVYNFVYVHTKNLWLPIASHAVTNGLLGLWIVAGYHWEFW